MSMGAVIFEGNICVNVFLCGRPRFVFKFEG